MKTKICGRCKEEKSVEKFYTHTDKGRRYPAAVCKKCTIVRNKELSVAKRINDFAPLLEGETWEWIEDYDNYYMVSDLGRVKGIGRWITDSLNHTRFVSEKLIKGSYDEDGYIHVTLTKGGIGETKRINILVGKTFIPNPNNYPVTNHKNAIRDDNRAVNLEWGTVGYNNNYKYDVMGYKFPKGEENKLSKKIIIIHPEGKEDIIAGILETSRRYNINKNRIYDVLNNKKDSYKGYKFKYAS